MKNEKRVCKIGDKVHVVPKEEDNFNEFYGIITSIFSIDLNPLNYRIYVTPIGSNQIIQIYLDNLTPID